MFSMGRSRSAFREERGGGQSINLLPARIGPDRLRLFLTMVAVQGIG
jgi:hypothetical protein